MVGEITPGTASQLQVWRGQYGGPLRSPKGKIKGLMLLHGGASYPIKLPKYLRPLLLREGRLGAPLQISVYPDGEDWRGVDLVFGGELGERPLTPPSPPLAPPICLQVCTKGKCSRRGGQQIYQALRQAVATDPAYGSIQVEAVGCLKACKQGPNLRVLPSGQLLQGLTPERALAWLASRQGVGA
jgi:hypothetical protein